jgi:cell division protein FtsL|tara:strand:- start:1165 stop:1470 length:306 start_codon:yes stop_codon:yes gene_type:complete
MKKFSVIFLILFLILFTALIKNSTKRIDDEIFALKENIRSLKKDFENIKLEHDYLSSAEKLLEFQNLYFDDELVKKDIQEIKTINQSSEKLEIGQLNLINE